MDFVNRLTPSHLRAFWYFASKTNFALIGTFGSLLWATAPGKEEAEFYRMRLKEYRWTLGVSTKAGTSDGGRGVKGLTEFALGMLDTSTSLLNALPEKPVLSRHGSEMPFQVSRSASDIHSFSSGFNFSSIGIEMGDSHNGLVSPSTSTSSGGAGEGFEAYLAAHPIMGLGASSSSSRGLGDFQSR